MIANLQAPSVGPSIDSIVGLYRERLTSQGADISRMAALRDNYNGDIIVPLPEMDRAEESAVANIIATGLDQTAMRIASTIPSVEYFPNNPADNASVNRARKATLANKGWWTYNDMTGKLRLRARRLIGYASAPISLRPDAKAGCAKWHLRDPLSTFPSTPDDATDMTPEDCIFAYQRTRAWIRQNYPSQIEQLTRRVIPTDRWGTTAPALESPDDQFTVLEYQDPECTVQLVLAQDSEMPNTKGLPYVELERTANRTGMTLVVTPGRFTLDRQKGQYDNLIGMNQAMSKLMALELIFAAKTVFPPSYLISRPGETATFASGPHPASSGMVNIIKDGEMREVPVSPGYAGDKMIDRLERNMRVTGGIAAEMGGESQSNVRTGKRGDSIMSAVIDFPVQEAQEILEMSLQHENKRAMAISKNYFGNEKKSFYITSKGSRGAKQHIDYTPNKDFESDNNVVSYPQAGADANGLVEGAGQRVAMQTLSKRSFMEIDPTVDDPQHEWEQIQQEQMLAAIMAGLTQKLQTGEIPVSDGARIMQMIADDKTPLQDAIIAVQKEAQARQATPAPAGSPATQPGLSTPGMGAEQPPTIPAGSQGQANLAQMLQQLHTTSQGA